MAAEAPKLVRDNTMQATAKEGIKFLEKEDPKLAEECKTVTEEAKSNGAGESNGAGDAPAAPENGDAKLVRDNTMVTTAQEGQEFLEKQGGVNADAKTRAQEVELNKSVEEQKENGDSDEKAATKRAAEEPEEAKEEVKKQKTEEECADKPESASEEKKEE